jgi:hypothetical protein
LHQSNGGRASVTRDKTRTMLIDVRTEKSVYIIIDGYTYYIDHSLDEPIVEVWTEEQEPLTLIPNDSDSED